MLKRPSAYQNLIYFKTYSEDHFHILKLLEKRPHFDLVQCCCLGGGNRFGVWRPGGYFCRRPASIENFLRRLASVLIMAFGVSKPHFLASSVHRASFPGVSRLSFFRVRQLNESSFLLCVGIIWISRIKCSFERMNEAMRSGQQISIFFRLSRQRGLTERISNSYNLILIIHPFEWSYLIGL